MSEHDPLIGETIAQVTKTLGSALDNLRVERAVFGLFFSGVKLSDGHGGLSVTPIKEIPEAVCCPSSAKAMPLSGRLAGRSARQYLDYLGGRNVLKRTLGIATLNALSAVCWAKSEERVYQLELGKDAFDEIDIDPRRKTVVVGALVPIIKKLMTARADFHILELDPRTLRPDELRHYAPVERAAELVSGADLLVVTGTTILNGTLAGLLSMARPGAEIVVAGPTASMLPDAFFARGVTLLGGTLVTKPDKLLDVISEGGSGYHFFGKSAERWIICRSRWQLGTCRPD